MQISIYIYMRQQLILYYCPKSFHYPGSPWRTLAKCTNEKKKTSNGTMLHLAACRKVATTGCALSIVRSSELPFWGQYN